jgi:uncharacterized protein (DUF1330 family)
MIRHALLAMPLLLGSFSAYGQTTPSPVYMIAEVDITDPAGYPAYGQAVSKIMTDHGAEFIARRGVVTPGIGDPPKAVNLIRFPSLEKAKGYLESAEYKALIPTRDKVAKFRTYFFTNGDPTLK